MKKPFREKPPHHAAGLFHDLRPAPLTLALLCLFPATAQAALNLPSFQIDPALLQPATKDQPQQQAVPKSSQAQAETGAAPPPAEVTTATEDAAPLRLKLSRKLTLTPPPGTPSTPAFINATRIQGHHGLETEAIGEAELRQWGQVVSADLLRYNKPDDEIYAQGNVRIDQEGDITEGPELKLKTGDKTGFMQQPVFQL
ncbi:MAG: hypothetical protein H5T84_08990, partial [Thermoleophilia bacterium]|nr:hypothetical protein [Thermoleophilia bacterium]